jgi:hypothetical protein
MPQLAGVALAAVLIYLDTLVVDAGRGVNDKVPLEDVSAGGSGLYIIAPAPRPEHVGGRTIE